MNKLTQKLETILFNNAPLIGFVFFSAAVAVLILYGVI